MKFDIGQDSYIAFRNIASERTSRIIAWVGSGLSAACGLPTWEGLRVALIKALENKALTLHPDERDSSIKECNEIKSIKDNWLAFERLKHALGETTFRETIRDSLKLAHTVPIPHTYNNLWRIRISGLLNLNIDRLATRARQSQTESAVIEFNGRRISDYLHILKSSPQPFILNLHGDYDDYSSWVLTRSDLNALRRTIGYVDFIRTCLLTSTVFFVGISADDRAVGGHLQELARITKDSGPHFWLTCRQDKLTDNWAEDLGIRVIRYDAKDNDHSGVNDFFEDLLSFVPKDEPAPPIEPQNIPERTEIVDDPKEIVSLDSETIRQILNKKAKEILKDASQESYSKYEEFVKKYDEAIYRAWYTCENSDILGYKLEKLHAKGAFGRVYKAKDAQGNSIAIKVLLEEERRKKEFLQSFRRGVRSMRILSVRAVDGIVGYKEAYEIPSFVVMDWVDGPNLDVAVRSKQINNWHDILKIARDLSHIIENAHRTPERVLHRDLRPPNIMLEGLYENQNSWKVVVLDFDLSWHLGASEKSIIGSGTTTGYLAPEQIQANSKISTRHSAVDSFGLGMTMFFLVSRRDPFPAENLHKDWEGNVIDNSLVIGCSAWKSIPRRFARLIINATKEVQSERWDINQIRGELDRLLDALIKPNEVESAELVAEEIFSRTVYSNMYKWDADKLGATIEFPSGTKLSLIGHESKKQVRLYISWMYGGGSTLKQLFKRIGKSFDDIKRQLASAKWTPDDRSRSGQSINFVAHLDVRDAIRRIDEIAHNLEGIVSAMKKLSSP
jgi:serine/threonine protein kinase